MQVVKNTNGPWVNIYALLLNNELARNIVRKGIWLNAGNETRTLFWEDFLIGERIFRNFLDCMLFPFERKV